MACRSNFCLSVSAWLSSWLLCQHSYDSCRHQVTTEKGWKSLDRWICAEWHRQLANMRKLVRNECRVKSCGMWCLAELVLHSKCKLANPLIHSFSTPFDSFDYIRWEPVEANNGRLCELHQIPPNDLSWRHGQKPHRKKKEKATAQTIQITSC